MICCYQVTKICGSRYGFAIASSAWGPCNFGPFTDLAISVFREMSIPGPPFPLNFGGSHQCVETHLKIRGSSKDAESTNFWC